MYLGKKVKSYEYKQYEKTVLSILPNDFIVPKGKLKLNIKVGVSSPLADVDNILKPFIDCLQLKYNFNDKMIYKLIVEKDNVPKGSEFIKFSLKEKV
jgi:Holliday junction resolvase RusA-like endonuclease